MKAIIEEYGSAVIALLVGAVILTAVGISAGGLTGAAKQALAGMLGKAEGWITAEGSASFDDYRGNGRIQVDYTNVSVMAGVTSPVSSHFTAVSEAGVEVSFGLRAVYDSDAVRLYTQIQEGKEYLYLEHPGIYRVYYEAVDALGRKQYGTLQIPVQRQ